MERIEQHLTELFHVQGSTLPAAVGVGRLGIINTEAALLPAIPACVKARRLR